MPLLSVIGALQVRPSSFECASFTAGVLLAPVNHASATNVPRDASAGPFTGHPPICQPSFNVTGFDQAPSVKRTTEMSRISSGERSR